MEVMRVMAVVELLMSMVVEKEAAVKVVAMAEAMAVVETEAGSEAAGSVVGVRAVVVGVVGGRHVVDPTAEEEAGAEATVELAINRKGNILGSQVFGPGALEPSLFRDIVEAACAAGAAYHRTFAEGLAGVGAGVG